MAFAKAPRLGRDDILGNRVSTRSFKIFSDNQKTDPAGTVGTSQKTRIPLRRKSVTFINGAISNTNNMKGISRITCKGKSSNENSEEYTKVTRKALADLSNLGGNTQRISRLSGSSTMKWKGVKCGNLQRISVGSTRVNDLSVKKSTKEPEIKRTTELGNNNPHKTVHILGQKFIKSKTLSLGSTAAGTRKSLPTLKRTSLAEKSLKKYNVSSLNSKQMGQGPASKVSNKGIPQLSSARTYTWKTRTSVGSIPSDRNSQKMNNVCTVRRSIKIQTTVKTSLQNRSSLKKPPVGRSKSRSILSVPSSDEVASTLSLPEKVDTECLKEDTQGKSSSSENKDPTTKMLDVTAKPKSRRRKSFTSLLVTGSKFDEKNGDSALQEKLPNIDDESNPLEVAEYVDDIYQFYWISEALNPALGFYLTAHTEVSPVTRGILINWLIEVHFKFDLMHETLYLTMNLLDRYLSQVPIGKNEMQLIGLTALLLASKYEDYWHPRINDLISISAESYTREQILGMERIMLKELKFRLNAPTPYVFMLRFLKAAQSNKKLEQLAFYLIELCLVEYEALKYKPSLLCASAIYVARCTLHMTPVWTSLLNNHTRYNVSQMKDSSDMILRFHKAAKTGKLRVTYEKYMNPNHSNVAVLKPLDKLPL
ncbi:putative cyclin-B3-1 isoform X2 [Capsella rubella]|uniref:putative cyclin-B3-1 isoform X2 n=1 Tax=Capsella rubella TaxID=81985 RepID=UPI000CD4ECBE|nr:putative cyclin-B3-1 isoform X2 [Capsella rubella]